MRRHKTINRRRLDVWKTIFKRRCTPVLQVILFRRSSIILCRCFFWPLKKAIIFHSVRLRCWSLLTLVFSYWWTCYRRDSLTGSVIGYPLCWRIIFPVLLVVSILLLRTVRENRKDWKKADWRENRLKQNRLKRE